MSRIASASRLEVSLGPQVALRDAVGMRYSSHTFATDVDEREPASDTAADRVPRAGAP
jgi:hypothetical protein